MAKLKITRISKTIILSGIAWGGLSAPANEIAADGKSPKNSQYQEQIAKSNLAISANAKDAKAYGVRGWAYENLGQYQKCIEDCSKALSLDPNDAESYYQVGANQCHSTVPSSIVQIRTPSLQAKTNLAESC